MQIVAGFSFFAPENWQDVALFSTKSGGIIGLAQKTSQISHRNEGIFT
jgi:hypothetical protein